MYNGWPNWYSPGFDQIGTIGELTKLEWNGWPNWYWPNWSSKIPLTKLEKLRHPFGQFWPYWATKWPNWAPIWSKLTKWVVPSSTHFYRVDQIGNWPNGFPIWSTLVPSVVQPWTIFIQILQVDNRGLTVTIVDSRDGRVPRGLFSLIIMLGFFLKQNIFQIQRVLPECEPD